MSDDQVAVPPPSPLVELRRETPIDRRRLAKAIDLALKSGLIPGLGVTWAARIADEYDRLAGLR